MTRQDAPRILVWAQTKIASDLRHATDELHALKSLETSRGFRVDIRRDAPWNSLADTLRQFDPHIFHFIGHERRGHLRVYLEDGGINVEHEVSAVEIMKDLLKAPNLVGIFLNGCQTSYWAPHLIPAGGWFIGANRDVNDHAAYLFAEHFYNSYDPAVDSAHSYQSALNHVALQPGASQPPIVRWVPELDSNDFLVKLFDRSAFRDPIMREGPLKDLQRALQDIQRSLQRRRIFTRFDQPTQTIVSCEHSINKMVIEKLRCLVKLVQIDLEVMMSDFPSLREPGAQWFGYNPHEQQRLMQHIDRIDKGRNMVIEQINDIVPSHMWLPEVA